MVKRKENVSINNFIYSKIRNIYHLHFFFYLIQTFKVFLFSFSEEHIKLVHDVTRKPFLSNNVNKWPLDVPIFIDSFYRFIFFIIYARSSKKKITKIDRNKG